MAGHASIRSTQTDDNPQVMKNNIRMQNDDTSPIEVKRTTMFMEDD